MARDRWHSSPRRTWALLAVLAVIVISAAGIMTAGLLGVLKPSTGPGQLAASSSPSTPATVGPTPSAAPTALPSPTVSPTASPMGSAAVLVGFPGGDGPSNTGYDVSIVGADGTTIATTHAPMPTHIYMPVLSGPSAIYLPLVNVAGNHVYYLSGDSEVRLLAPDGSTHAVTTIAGSSTAHAAFAVSPDENRIAVGVLDYSAGASHTEAGTASSGPVVTHLYVEDLGTHANRVEIFTSSTLHVWPIAWQAGRLVLAVGGTFTQQGLVMNPYSASELHVVDPQTAIRLATMGSASEGGCWPTGLLSAVGIACYTRTATSGGAGTITVLGWDGAVRPGSPMYDTGSAGGEASVSTDGTRLAVNDSNSPIVVRSLDSTAQTALTPDPRAQWPCWIDDNHIMSSRTADYSPFQGAVPNGIVSLDTGSVVQTQARGLCVAVTPSAVH